MEASCLPICVHMTISHKPYSLASGILDVPMHIFFGSGESTTRAQSGLQNAHHLIVRKRESANDQTFEVGKKENRCHLEMTGLIKVDPPVPTSPSERSIVQDTRGPSRCFNKWLNPLRRLSGCHLFRFGA
jgi:hypothetical protein